MDHSSVNDTNQESGHGESVDSNQVTVNEPSLQRLRLFPRPVPPTELLAAQTPSYSIPLDQNWNISWRRKKKEESDEESDADKCYSKYLEPHPSKWPTNRNVFTGYGYFFRRERKRLVRFPEDVVEKAESDQRFGETMGKLREVKRSTKHRQKLSALLTGSAQVSEGENRGKPDLRIYNVKPEDLPYPTDGDSWLLADDPECNCFCRSKKSTKAGYTAEQERTPPAEYSDKFKVTEQKFCRCLDVIEEFVVGNLKTIDYTLGVIGLQPLETAQESEQNQEAERFNHIAAGIWFFVFALSELFQNDPPTRSEFKQLLIDFSNLAVFIDRVARRTVIFAKLHHAFGEAALTKLKSATNRLYFKSTVISRFQIKPPIKLGQGLKLRPSSSQTSIDSRQSNVAQYKVVTRRKYSEPTTVAANPWLPFGSQDKSFKLEYLNEFMAKLQHRLSTLNSQMRFLTDDIFEEGGGSFRGRRRKKVEKKSKDQTFLSALHSLDVVMYRFAVFDETTPSYERAMMETMESVTSDTFDLITKGEKIIEAIIEVRDTTELGINYMKLIYGIDFDDLIPSTVEFNSNGKTQACRQCWRKFFCLCIDDPIEPSPGFSAQDFFNTSFPQHLHRQSMMNSQTGYEFALQKCKSIDKKPGVLRCKPEGRELLLHLASISSLTLSPALGGQSGVWDDLSKLDITQLKGHVVDHPLEMTDIRPAITAEIQKREDFKRAVNNLYTEESDHGKNILQSSPLTRKAH